MALLVVGVALASSTGRDSKAALRNSQSIIKVRSQLQASPDFQFIGQGRIVGGSGETWLIAGVPVQVDGHTQIVGDVQVGSFVVLSGRILKNGAWSADQVEQSDLKDSSFTFNGPLVSMDKGLWVIGDKSLVVNGQTQVEADLALDDPLLVTFTLQADGSWLALKIEHFDEPLIEPSPTPTETLESADDSTPEVITAPKDEPPAKPKSTGNHGRGKGRGHGGGHGHGGGEGDD